MRLSISIITNCEDLTRLMKCLVCDLDCAFLVKCTFTMQVSNFILNDFGIQQKSTGIILNNRLEYFGGMSGQTCSPSRQNHGLT
jgi:hypothetical protein